MMTVLRNRVRLLALALVLPAAWAAGGMDAVTEALKRPAIAAKQPAQAVLISAAQAGDRIVAVGERGLVLVSDDAGASWAQRPTPVSVTLTGVRFADARNGVAFGHAGAVLLTADGGDTWSLALNGRRAAELALEAARAMTGDDEGKAFQVDSAERLVADGPDKPFLDALVEGRRIVVVGAYGLAFASDDGGSTWTSWMPRLDNPGGMYIYAIRKRGDTLLLAGEQGLLLRSDDDGATFRSLESPYEGSWFTAEFGGEGEIVLAGLRGNAWRSVDDGAEWALLEGSHGASLTASARLPDGGLLFGNQAGQLLRLGSAGLVPLNPQPLPPINGVHASATGVLALTMQGAIPVPAGANE